MEYFHYTRAAALTCLVSEVQSLLCFFFFFIDARSNASRDAFKAFNASSFKRFSGRLYEIIPAFSDGFFFFSQISQCLIIQIFELSLTHNSCFFDGFLFFSEIA